MVTAQAASAAAILPRPGFLPSLLALPAARVTAATTDAANLRSRHRAIEDASAMRLEAPARAQR